jgi:hypothetical protein
LTGAGTLVAAPATLSSSSRVPEHYRPGDAGGITRWQGPPWRSWLPETYWVTLEMTR